MDEEKNLKRPEIRCGGRTADLRRLGKRMKPVRPERFELPT
jgi:hypothetical protein